MQPSRTADCQRGCHSPLTGLCSSHLNLNRVGVAGPWDRGSLDRNHGVGPVLAYAEVAVVCPSCDPRCVATPPAHPEGLVECRRPKREPKQAVARPVHAPRVAVPLARGMRLANHAAGHAQRVVACQPPTAVPDQSGRQRGVVIHGHAVAPHAVAMGLVVVGEAGVAGTVSPAVDPPTEGAALDAPVPGVQALPVVAVVERIGAVE